MDYVYILGVKVVIELKDLGDSMYGCYRASPYPKIELRKDLKGKFRKKVLQHEMFHALLDISGISGAIPYGLEEQIVTCLEYHAESITKEVAKFKFSE